MQAKKRGEEREGEERRGGKNAQGMVQVRVERTGRARLHAVRLHRQSRLTLGWFITVISSSSRPRR